MAKHVPEQLTAYQIDAEEDVPLVGRAHPVRAYTGDWVITRNGTPIDIASPARFAVQYETPAEGQLVLPAAVRTALEQRLGFGSTKDADTLLQTVLRLASCSIGAISVSFSTLQWEEIARRASKRRQTPEVYLRGVVDKLLADLWTSVA